MFEPRRECGYEFKGETHDFWEYMYVVKGSIFAVAGEKVYILNEGEIIFQKLLKEKWAYLLRNIVKIVPELNPILFHQNRNMTKKFCKKFADMYGTEYCVATSSGTASIHVALGALGVVPGDEVITSPITD